MSGPDGPTAPKRGRALLRGAFGVLAVGFLAAFAWRSRGQLAAVLAAADLSLIAAAVGLWKERKKWQGWKGRKEGDQTEAEDSGEGEGKIKT